MAEKTKIKFLMKKFIVLLIACLVIKVSAFSQRVASYLITDSTNWEIGADNFNKNQRSLPTGTFKITMAPGEEINEGKQFPDYHPLSGEEIKNLKKARPPVEPYRLSNVPGNFIDHKALPL